MLETINLCKTYKPRKGVPCKALDNVSLKLPSSGMIFLLGKSGSGKSTLLNVLGGLDKFDSGEIIVKGKSTKAFKQSHFDSYRNTYIGFIFQEYNILEEFTVGANIALAMELQGKKATNEEINKILKEVDLLGYASRKPNELSGGQKQRVAIARALIKNPEIIMADEPTGALDSVTGKQVFNTLKKLSKTKLVLIVSHDREFAENYADRIIELADGKVISDVENSGNILTKNEPLTYSGNEIEIQNGYLLTEDDRKQINEYLSKIKTNAIIKVSSNETKNHHFVDTDQTKIKLDNSGFNLIKSKLNLKNSFKIGASGLKYKKIKLIITIFLSFIAFTLFGLADTIASFDKVNTYINSIIDSSIDYASFVRSEKVQTNDNIYWNTGVKFSQNQYEEIKQISELDLIGVYSLQDAIYFYDLFPEEEQEIYNIADFYPDSFYPSYLNNAIEVNQELLNKLNYKLLGTNSHLPNNKNEIMVTDFIYKLFNEKGLKNKKIKEYNDLIGVNLPYGKNNLVICGIVDTNMDYERYAPLKSKDSNYTYLQRIILQTELDSLKSYSLHNVVFAHSDLIKEMQEISNTKFFSLVNDNLLSLGNNFINTVANFNNVKSKVIMFEKDKITLNDDELILPINYIFGNSKQLFNSVIKKDLREMIEVNNILPYGNEKKILEYTNMNFEDIISNIKETYQLNVIIDSINNRFDEVKDFIKQNLSKKDYLTFLGVNNEEELNEITKENLEKKFMDYYYLYYKYIDDFAQSLSINLYDGLFDYVSYLQKQYQPLKDYLPNKDTINLLFYDDNHNPTYSFKYIDLFSIGSYLSLTDVDVSECIKNFIMKKIYKNPTKWLNFYNTYSNYEANEINRDVVNYITYYIFFKYNENYNSMGEYQKNIPYDYDIGFNYETEINEFISKLIIANKEYISILNLTQESNTLSKTNTYKLVGIYTGYNFYPNSVVLSENNFNSISKETENLIYSYVVADMPTKKEDIKKLANIMFKYTNNDNKYILQNSVTFQFEQIESILSLLGKVFLYVGIGFAIFASAMLSNFIATSISYKKREIGILRAIGSRSNDVFKIFLSESFIIAIINYILSLIATIIVCNIIDFELRINTGILVTVLNFGIRQVLVLFVLIMIVTIMATFLPVKKIASKRPIDAIKNK